MPRQSRGPHLWLRPGRRRARDGSFERPVWIIRDGNHRQSTGCGESERGDAEKRLAGYLAGKHQTPPRRERDLSAIPVADVLNLYLTDVAPDLARPQAIAARCDRLLDYFGAMTLDEITGASCRAYAAWREGKGPAVKGGRKGTGGGARRDLQDLAAAIGHHAAEGYHRGLVRVPLPPKGEARQRWLDRSEFARLLWTCWRAREVQDGVATRKRPLRHLCRFLLLGLYTGSRPGAVLRASWLNGPGRSFVDTRLGVFHRRSDGAAETKKRQPTVRLTPRLLSHLRRWRRIDEAAGRTWVVTFDGQPVASVKTALARACKLAGIPDATAYALRHSCASWMVQAGVSTRVIADFLGTSEAMILAHYGHLAPDYQEQAVTALSRRGRML